MRDTLLSAYGRIAETLTASRGQVFGVFYTFGRMCDFQAAAKLGWPINRVTGRRQELEAMGYLIDRGKSAGPPYGHEVHHFEVNPACLNDGWQPKEIAKKNKPQRQISVREAARVLASARKGKKHKPPVMTARKQLPLFA